MFHLSVHMQRKYIILRIRIRLLKHFFKTLSHF